MKVAGLQDCTISVSRSRGASCKQQHSADSGTHSHLPILHILYLPFNPSCVLSNSSAIKRLNITCVADVEAKRVINTVAKAKQMSDCLCSLFCHELNIEFVFPTRNAHHIPYMHDPVLYTLYIVSFL